jgi:hypothetical protein
MRRTVLVTILALAACSDEGGGDEIIAVPFPTTIELTADDLESLESAAADGTLVFDPAPDALADVAVGRILVGGVSDETPGGLLRAVLAVARDGDRLTLGTAVAPIQLAYRKLHVKLARREAAVVGATARRTPAEGFDVTMPFDFLLFDGDGDPETDDDQIHFQGEVGGGFEYELEIDVDWGDIDALPDLVTSCLESLVEILEGELPSCSVSDLLPEAQVRFVVTPEVRADANVSGAAILEYEKEIDLASKTLAPIIIGPLVFLPVVDVTARLAGGASGRFSTGIHGSATFQTSVVASSLDPTPEWIEPELIDTDFGVNPTTVSLTAAAQVGIGARLNVLLFAVTGPYATARAFARVEADLLGDPCWELSAGVEANLGVKVTAPAPLLGDVTLVDWASPTVAPLEIALDSGTCEPLPEVSELPPGAGPDAERLASPTFAQWSRSWSSPVEGGHAGSPGNGVLFSDLQRTIDGNYVRSGYGTLALTKWRDTGDGGELVWSRELALEGGGRLSPLRVRPTPDAGLMVASTAVTAPVLLTELTQDGRVVSARAFDVALSDCQVGIRALEPDGAGGWYVMGECVGAKSFLLHVRAGGAAEMWVVAAGDLNGFGVKMGAVVGGDAFLSGTLNDGLDALFALRVAPGGELVWARRYLACDEAPDAIPSAAIVGDEGDITIAGSGGAQHNGIFVRLRGDDGAVGFASFPGFGFGAGSVFLLDSLAELPTTGYVVGGSAVQFGGDEPQSVPSAALLGLDATGRVRWAKRYTYGAPGAFQAAGHVAVRLTDDGGALATALVTDPDDPLGGILWAWKAFAKDGEIEMTDGEALVTELGASDLECGLTASPLAGVTIESVDVAGQSIAVVSSAVALDQASQTAQLSAADLR